MRFGIREAVFFLVLLAVPVASFLYVFKPRNDEISAAQHEIELKQAKLQQLGEVTDRIDDLGLAIEEGRRAIEQIEAKLPSQRDVETILEGVWQLAKQNGQTLRWFKSDKPVPAALYMEQPLKVATEGDFDGFYQFLLELENLPRITRVHQMKLERLTGAVGPQREDVPPGAMKAEFTLSIYFESPLMSNQFNP